MKKSMLVIMLVACLTLTAFAIEEAKYDFRKTTWGMSREQVRETETLDEISSLHLFIAIKEYEPDTVYTIQVGTFLKEEDAQNLAKELRGEGYLTHVTKGETLYKVQVREFKSYKDAQSLLDKMEKDKELRKILDLPGRFDLLRYEDYIWHFDCSIYYWFMEDKLYESAYYLNENILHEDPRIGNYEELKRLLTKKYGKPVMDKEVWIDDLAKRNESNRETAINKGCLECRTGWETSTTKISMVISGYKNKTYLLIGYSSKELEEWAEQIRAETRQKQDEEILKDF